MYIWVPTDNNFVILNIVYKPHFHSAYRIIRLRIYTNFICNKFILMIITFTYTGVKSSSCTQSYDMSQGRGKHNYINI